MMKSLDEFENPSKIIEFVFNSMPFSYIFWKNTEGIYLGGSSSQLQLFDNQGKGFIGKTIFEILDDFDAAKTINDTDNKIMREGIPIVIEEAVTSPGGEEKIFLSQKQPVRDSQNNIIGLIGFAIDITERKKIEEQLQRMKSLAASIAHEIRTPLASIEVCSQIIEDFLPIFLEAYEKIQSQDPSFKKLSNYELHEFKEAPHIIHKETHASNIFIDMMLMNMEPQLGTKENFMIKEAVLEALYRYPFKENQKERVSFIDGIDFLVYGSKSLLVHTLFNLLKNALYYTHEHGNITIWFETTDVGSNKLHFKDTGEGIASDVLPHIFEQFYTRTYHGAGIGLTFCKIVMESLGGSICCNSLEGSHTEFILTFPKLEYSHE